MKKIIFLIGTALLIFTASVNAEYKIYNNVLEFEKAKGEICEQATDGCNSYSVVDGKVTSGTEIYCKNHTPEWTCTKLKEGTVTTMSLPITKSEDNERVCTMEYKPVCAKVQIQCITTPCNPILKTFSNACMAGNNEIVYEGMCNEKLSENDISFYNSIKTSKLENKYTEKVYKTLDKYKQILSKYPETKKNIYNQIMLRKIDNYIKKLTLNYPQDVALPEKINIKYLMLKLLEFEIKIL